MTDSSLRRQMEMSGSGSHLFYSLGCGAELLNGCRWDMWQPGLALVDFTNPGACKWYASKLEALVDMAAPYKVSLKVGYVYT
jgi:hypothetical protein